MLDKRLQLGGLQVGGPRTMQNSARFRVANNVYQTRDDYIVPRSGSVEYKGGYVSSSSMKTIARYKNKPFVMGHNGTSYVPYYESVNPIVTPGLPDVYGSYGVQAIEKLGNLYLNFPSSGLFKYDGAMVYRAGSPLPWARLENTYEVSTTFYVRTMQHHIDQQGNVVNSGYIQNRARQVSDLFKLRVDKGALAGASDNTPRSQIEVASMANGFASYFIGTISDLTDVGNTIVVTTGGDHLVETGARICAGNGISYIFNDVALSMASFEVIAHTATTVTLGNMKYLDLSNEWKEWDYSQSATLIGVGSKLSNYYISVYTCTAETGNYALQRIVPSMYESEIAHIVDVYVSAGAIDTPNSNYVNNAFNLGLNMGDTYDVTSVKSLFPVTTEYLPTSFSTYGDLGLVSYSNEIYFSDTTQGGAFEMTNALAFIVVGEGDDGDIQSVCGTSDFALVSRQFKNYFLSGSIPTANYKSSEISQTSLGTYSNEASLAVSDKIIFFNKQGVWALYSGGRCEEVSQYIRGMFDNFSGTTGFQEEEYFNLDTYPTYASPIEENEWVKLRMDVARNLIAFVVYGGGEGKALVLNLNNGEFYTWSNISYGVEAPDFQDMDFIDGFFYHTQNGAATVAVNVEDKASTSYESVSPPTLQTTWFTAGEPSLEKKLNQLKIWGLIGATTVNHCVDWNTSFEVPDGEYLNTDSDLFSHKHRMTPANFLSASVGMKFLGKFQVEGLEIEFSLIQQGMKR